jgi:hypothetical protein
MRLLVVCMFPNCAIVHVQYCTHDKRLSIRRENTRLRVTRRVHGMKQQHRPAQNRRRETRATPEQRRKSTQLILQLPATV